MARFLLADDSQGKRDFLTMIIHLSKLDAELVIAKNTDDAKELIEQYDDIEFAFIDYEMPKENGPAVIRVLKEKNPNAHIALVTSGNSDKYEQDGYDAGAQAFICTSWPEERQMEAFDTLLTEWKHL